MIYLVQDKWNSDFQGQVWGRGGLHNSTTEVLLKRRERRWTAHYQLAEEESDWRWLDGGWDQGGWSLEVAGIHPKGAHKGNVSPGASPYRVSDIPFLFSLSTGWAVLNSSSLCSSHTLRSEEQETPFLSREISKKVANNEPISEYVGLVQQPFLLLLTKYLATLTPE